MKTAIWIVVVIVVVVAGILLYRSSYKSSSTNSPNSDNPVSTTSVSIENFSFNPSSITISAGQEVTFTNNESTTHTITADDNSFDSGELGRGESFRRVFDKAGTFSYHCSIHTTMKGIVEVK